MSYTSRKLATLRKSKMCPVNDDSHSKNAPMKRLLTQFAGILLGAYGVTLRITCRIHLHNDQRQAVSDLGYRYVFGTGHAYQISVLIDGELGTGAMVSRSLDGGLVVPMLKWCGHVPIRGSSGTGRKGGGPALQALIKHVIGGNSAMLAFDGPRGPKDRVQPGVAMLAAKSHSAVVLALGRPRYRFILKSTWDRFQIPVPFTRIDLYFSDPMMMDEGETVEHFKNRLQETWNQLQNAHDPDEATASENAPSANKQVAA